jgi:hypothetical protein
MKSPLHNQEAPMTRQGRGLYFKESAVAGCTIYLSVMIGFLKDHDYRQPLSNEE